MPETLRSLSHWGAFRVNVEEGVITSVAPFEHDPSPTRLIDAWPEMITSTLRIKQPVVRRGWLDHDGGAGRGSDSFVEVDWPRALDLVAAELRNVRDHYGNQAIFGGSYGWSSAGRIHHARTLTHRFLNSIGGFTDQITNYSYGAAMTLLPHVTGGADVTALSSWKAICENAEVLVAFGGLPEKNWEVQSGGFGLHTHPSAMQQLEASNVEVINVSPRAADVSVNLSSRWVPIRPNTDAALAMAITHWLVAHKRHDREFLERYCVGFDQYEEYLSGRIDGQPKSPAWAADITGIPADMISGLAEKLSGRRVMLTAAWSLQRARHGEQAFWSIIALAAALGQIGLRGCGVTFGYGSMNGGGNPDWQTPLFGLDKGDGSRNLSIPVARISDMLLHPGGEIEYDGKRLTYPEIQLIYWAGGNPFHHHQDINRLRKALGRPRTIVVHEPFWTDTARFADIVLPATTPLERNDIGGSSRDPFIFAMHRAVPPIAGARDDYDIFSDLADRLGSGVKFTGGRSADEWICDSWRRTRETLRERGVSAPEFSEFWHKGYYRLPDVQDDFTLFEKFREDPVRSPLRTPSGRIQLFSRSIAQTAGIRGHPVWLDPEEWLGATLAKRYPLHLLTPQPAGRLHSQMEQSAHSLSLKRDGLECLEIHPEDARARGIFEGGIVRLFNDRGACLASARFNAGIVRGVVSLPTGATSDPVDGYFDRGSNANVLTRDIGTSIIGQGCSAQSCLIEVELFELWSGRNPVGPPRILANPYARAADESGTE